MHDLDEHRLYLADQPRVSAFRQAITAVVRPGDVVLDLGAGTGIMGMLACEAGAGRVYAVDSGGMIEVARSVSRANGFQDRVIFIKGLSRRVDLPEQVDVVVADQIGRFGFDAGVLEYFYDARKRFLKPGGKLIPSQIDLIVAPVECPELWEQVEFWKNTAAGFDLSVVRKWAVNTSYPVKYQTEHLLGVPFAGSSLDLYTVRPGPFKLQAEIVAHRAGTLHGVGAWFEAILSPDVKLTNSPLSPRRINRNNLFFPIDGPVDVDDGDRFKIEMQISPTDVRVTWRVTVLSADQKVKARFAHSTWYGMLLTSEDLQLTRPDYVPQLSPRGRARMTVLSLCDGRTLAEIENEVSKRHPELFRSRAEAAVFVAESVARYSATPYDAVSIVRSHS
jgi:predicted RNA methylase